MFEVKLNNNDNNKKETNTTNTTNTTKKESKPAVYDRYTISGSEFGDVKVVKVYPNGRIVITKGI